jgi:hypothetical protein
MPPTIPESPPPAPPIAWNTVLCVFDCLEKAGYHRGDDQHVGRAVSQLAALVQTYTGAEPAS